MKVVTKVEGTEVKIIKDNIIERILDKIVKASGLVSAVFLFCLMSLIFIDVFMRYFFNRPILGGTELVEFLMALTISLSLAYGQYLKRHVFVEIFYQKLKGRAKFIADIIVYIMCFGIYILISIYALQQAEYLFQVKMTSQVLLIPVWPFRVVLSIGALIYCLAIVRDVISTVKRFIYGIEDTEPAAPDANIGL